MFRVPWQKLEGTRCIAVNNSYQIAPWSEVIWFSDKKWWDWHKEKLMNVPMKISTCCEHREVLKYSHLSFYRRDLKQRYGISKREGFISWNGSSGAAAINLAYHMGAKTVVLLGFDMRRVEGEKNWHSDHRENPNGNPFSRHLKAFPYIKKDALDLDLSILNATPDSAIASFPFVSLEDLL